MLYVPISQLQLFVLFFSFFSSSFERGSAVDLLLARPISLKHLGRNDKPAAIRLIKWESLKLQLRLQVCSS